MGPVLKKIGWSCILAGLALSGTAAQESPSGGHGRTGLIPLDAEQVSLILETWPRVDSVGFNWLGFKRVNVVRAGKGRTPLDPRTVQPVGQEVASSIRRAGAPAQAAVLGTGSFSDLPVSVDNSSLPYFPPIRSQGSLGSCVSFAITYLQLSYMTAFARNLDIRNDAVNTDKYSPKWSYNMINGGTDGGSSFGDVYTLLFKHGAATWSEFPYDGDYRAWCLDTDAWQTALDVRTRQVQYLDEVSSDARLEQTKELLVNGYVVVFGTYISSWQYKTILNDPSTADDDAEVGKDIGYWVSGSEGSHAMTIVGYNDAIWTDVNGNGTIDSGEKGAFKIANSWGTGWGDGGFVWLAYDALQNPSAVSGGPTASRGPAFQGDLAFSLTARDGYAPLMIARFTVNHAKRDQLKMSLGRSETSTTSPTAEWTPSALNYRGGAYAFDGAAAAIDGTFILDLTDLLTVSGSTQRFYLGMRDNTPGDTATLSAFKVLDLTKDPPAEVVFTLVPQYADNGQQVYAYVDYAWGGANPVPHLTSFSPARAEAAGDGFTLTVAGTGFVPGSFVTWDGNSLNTTYLSATELHASVTTGLTAGGGQYPLTVVNPAPGGGTSEVLSFPLDNPVPNLASVAPSKATAGGAALNLTMMGSEFVPGSVVRWNGSDKVTTFESRYFLKAAVPASDIATGGEYEVAVFNPAPGGGTSSVFVFPVSTFTMTPSPASVTVTAGQSASCSIVLASAFGPFGSSVSFSCTGLPAGCTASFSPTTVTPGSLGGTTTLTFKTTASGTTAAGATFGAGGFLPALSGMSAFLLTLLLWQRFLRPISGRPGPRRFAAAALVSLIVLAVACSPGGGGNDSGGTPRGTYPVTVRGQSGGLTVTTTVTLVVN